MKKNILTLAITFFAFTLSFAQVENEAKLSKSDYILYSVKKGKTVKPKSIIKDMADIDVLFFGEEHNDSIGHRLQTILFKNMFQEFGDRATISMEMFDRDVQHIMDEYLNGIIKKRYFNKDSRKWNNYKDYRPMVEFAKENGLDVICANAPFRYVSVANAKGMDALMDLTDEAKRAMAPLPYTYATGKYADKLNALMAGMNDSTSTKPKYKMIPGQSLWDVTMAYSIYEYLQKNKGSKILHLNGRFHTEEFLGIVGRLKEYDPNISSLVITTVGDEENYPKVDFEKYKHLGDYILFTNPEVPKSY